MSEKKYGAEELLDFLFRFHNEYNVNSDTLRLSRNDRNEGYQAYRQIQALIEQRPKKEKDKKTGGEYSKRELMQKIDHLIIYCQKGHVDHCHNCKLWNKCRPKLKKIKALIEQGPKVSKKDIFDFHNNLFSICMDSKSEDESLQREIGYIENWLKEKEVEIK